MNNDNKLFLYENNIDLVVTTTDWYVDNRPMNNRHLKAHKGLTNELVFTVRDRDRKIQNVSADTVRAYVVHPTSKQRLLTKTAINSNDVGKFSIVLNEGDLANIDPGRYYMYISRSRSEVLDTPMYADQDNNIVFDLEITNQTGTEPKPTQSTTDLIKVADIGNGDPANVFVTSALAGNLEQNFPNAQHSMAIYLEEYTGNITVQASCFVSVPSSDEFSTDWFDVENISVADANTSIVSTNFVVNCNWIRIISTPDTGSVTKVSLRN
jgi:hypothetical protein